MMDYVALSKKIITPYELKKGAIEDTMCRVSADIWACCELPYSEATLEQCYMLMGAATKCFADIIIADEKYNNLAARNLNRGFKKHLAAVTAIADDEAATAYFYKTCYRLKGIASVFDELATIITDEDLSLESDDFIRIMANALVHTYSEGNVASILKEIENNVINVRPDNKQRYLIHLDAAITLMKDIISNCMPAEYNNEKVVQKFNDLTSAYTLKGYEKQKNTVYTPITRSIKALIAFFESSFDEHPEFALADIRESNKQRSQNNAIAEFASAKMSGNTLDDADNTPSLQVYLLMKGIFDPTEWLKAKFGKTLPVAACDMEDYLNNHPEYFS